MEGWGRIGWVGGEGGRKAGPFRGFLKWPYHELEFRKLKTLYIFKFKNNHSKGGQWWFAELSINNKYGLFSISKNCSLIHTAYFCDLQYMKTPLAYREWHCSHQLYSFKTPFQCSFSLFLNTHKTYLYLKNGQRKKGKDNLLELLFVNSLFNSFHFRYLFATGLRNLWAVLYVYGCTRVLDPELFESILFLWIWSKKDHGSGYWIRPRFWPF